MDNKDITKYSLYAAGGVVLLIGGIVAVSQIKKVNFSASNTKVGADKKSEDIVGKTLSLGSESYVNIRSTPEIPGSSYNCSWYDPLCYARSLGSYAANMVSDESTENILKKSTSNPVGTVEGVVKGADGWNWYKISFTGTSIDFNSSGWVGIGVTTSKEIGYVREDVVTVNY